MAPLLPDPRGRPPLLLLLTVVLVTAALAPGCLSGPEGPGDPVPRTFSFDFSRGEQGWQAAIAHYVVGDEANMHFEHGVRALPANLGGADALYVSSTNSADDLFVFFTKRLDGLVPGAQYHAWFNVTLASRDAAGGVGIGGSPGDSVHVRAGAAGKAFERYVGDDTRYKIAPDPGDSINPGEHGVHLGSIGKPDDGTKEYALVGLNSSASELLVTPDAGGHVWAIFGTDSGYEGLTSMYYTSLRIDLVPVT